jgi:hypothetical protein
VPGILASPQFFLFFAAPLQGAVFAWSRQFNAAFFSPVAPFFCKEILPLIFVFCYVFCQSFSVTSSFEKLPLKNGRMCGFSLKISKCCGACLTAGEAGGPAGLLNRPAV